jgi:ParB/Sulfiredoxin domain
MSFREIDVSAFDQVVPADQPAPMLQWVPIKDLVIDDSYQRELAAKNRNAIKKIAADFRWSRFAPVLLAPVADGRFAIIDGQHRTHAAKVCGIKSIPAMIVQIEPSEQASAFAFVNSATTKITLHHIYKAALTAGEPWALSMKEAVEGAGCDLRLSNQSTAKKKPGQIYCIGLVRDLEKKGYLKYLTAVLKALVEYDTTNRVPLYSDFIIRPMTFALAESGVYRRLDIAEFLRQNDPFKVINSVDRLMADGKIEGARKSNYREAFRVQFKQFARAQV